MTMVRENRCFNCSCFLQDLVTRCIEQESGDGGEVDGENCQRMVWINIMGRHGVRESESVASES